MRSAQLTGLEGESDVLGNEMGANSFDCPAREVAALSQGWDPIDLLADEDALELAQVFAAMRIRAIRSLKSFERWAVLQWKWRIHKLE